MLTMRTLIVVGVPLEDAKGGLGPFLWKVVYQVLNNEDVKRDLESYSDMLGYWVTHSVGSFQLV